MARTSSVYKANELKRALANAKLRVKEKMGASGWKEIKKKNWVIFKSPDGKAWLGFVEYQSGAEATKKLAEVADMFDAHDIHWSPVRNEKLGEGDFPAKVADGPCKLKGGGEGDISYAAVNPPGKGELLIVYVVHKDGAHPMARPAAIAAIKSMRTKGGHGGGKGKH